MPCSRMREGRKNWLEYCVGCGSFSRFGCSLDNTSESEQDPQKFEEVGYAAL